MEFLQKLALFGEAQNQCIISNLGITYSSHNQPPLVKKRSVVITTFFKTIFMT